VGATEDLTFFLDAVADDSTAAARTARRKQLDRALKAIKDVTLSISDYLE
jgi:hypothetical protein